MAIRYKALTELYHETQRSVTAPAQWQAFLASACRNYRLSFDEQLLVYAQRPDATAVLEIERWNKRFGRWVNRGANGIAVFDGKSERPRLKYYFDISDTHEGNFPQPVPLWAVRPGYEPEIIETLENSFGELEHKENLGAALLSAAKNAVEDNIQDYLSELKNLTEGSFLEELDDLNLEVLYRKALENSIGYMLMVRCGLDPAGTFEDEDFRDVLNFNTPETLNALGVATGDISQMCLSEISRTVLALQRQPQKENRTFAGQPQIQYAVTEQRNQPSERSFENERDHIHETGRLQPAEPSAPAGAGGSLWEIRIASEEVSERTQANHLHEPADQRAALQPSGGDRADGPAPDGADGDTDGQRERRDGGAEGARPDEVGRADEQPSERSGGDYTERADLQLISEPEQPSTLNAEEADSPELPAFLDEKQIMAVIANKDDDLKYKKQQIELFFSVHPDTQERADYLKTAYQDRYTEIIADGQRLGYKPQEDGLLVWEGSYPTRTKEAVFSWDLVAEWTAQLIDKKEYFIQTDIPKLPTQEGQQMSLFDFAAFQQAQFTRSSPAPEQSKKEPEAFENQLKRYDLGYGHLGNGLTVWNRLEEEHGDYKTVAHIAPDRTVQIYDEEMPQAVRVQIQHIADTSEMTVSATQDAPVFHTPPKVQEPPQKEEAADPYSKLAAQVLYFIGEFDGSRMGYGDTDVQAVEIIAEQLHDPARREEIRRLLQSFLDHADPEEEIAADITLCIEEMEGLPTGLTPEDIERYEQQMTGEQNEAEAQPKKEEAPPLPQKRPRRERVTFASLHPEIPREQRHDFHITDDSLGHGTPSEKYAANAAAIRTLKQIEAEERLATPEEQEILSRYVGWGGLADCFEETSPHYQELKSLLDEDEYAAARASSLTAFYTPPVVIRGIYKALSQMGFQQGNILEPSCGTGNFFGLLPADMAGSKTYGVELDSISGRIAQQLYQNASISINGFEKVQMPDSFFDVVVGNVPFGDFKVRDKRYDKNNFLIHDYFFAKAIDKVRPGGVLALITSNGISGGTFDKRDNKVRKYIAQRCDLIGAIRLPNNTFSQNAGTDITTDVLFFQKLDRQRSTDVETPDWVDVDIIHENDHVNAAGETRHRTVSLNQYYRQHPEMVLGDLEIISGPFGPQLVCKPTPGAELSEQLAEAIPFLQAEIKPYELEELDEEEDRSIPADPNVKNFSYTVADGQVYYRENSRMHPVEVSITAENRIRGMIELRECVRRLIDYQTEGYPDADVKAEQKKLNTLYDSFTKKYGLINSRGNKLAFSEDSSYCLLCSLEVLDEEGSLKRKADMFTKRTIRPHVAVTSVDTASEALAVSIAEKARVDMEYMAQLSGKSPEELETELSGVIFRNIEGPENPDGLRGASLSLQAFSLVTADEYLSGNVRRKLRMAKAFLEAAPDSQKAAAHKQVEALEAVQPQDLGAGEIGVRIGANWVPIDVYQQFMWELLTPYGQARSRIKILRSEATGQWTITEKNFDRANVKATATYGTKRMSAYHILEQTLNQKDVRVFDYIEDEHGNKKPVLNKKETAIAQDRQELIKQRFSEWVWKDIDRRERLCAIYNETFNSSRPREYDGRHIRFDGMNPERTLRPHQINAIAHVMYGGNTLLAHEVGAGKTFEMVAAAMEMKRLGLCTKSLVVVPNHITEQWAASWLELYPSANILVATKKDFETQNRKKFCSRIATGDYDAVIIGHSQFEKIPMSAERQQAILQQQIDEILFGIEQAKAQKAERYTIKQMERTRKSLEAKLEKLNDQSRKDDVVTFEQLGVDRLFVDESHYFKNLFLMTKMRNVGGIAQTEAQKSSDLFMKCRYLDELTGGRGVIFATGTPISNSMVELYTIQRYLQYGLLQEMGLIHFDDWASDFGETITAIELSPEGTGYRAKTRFAKFFNLPELMAAFKQVADIQTADMLHLPVPKANFHTEVIKPSELQQEMVKGLAERAEKIRGGGVDPHVDNMLRITNDGRKLALDMRLINPLAADDPNGKVAVCSRNVYKIWEQTKEQRSTQLVFCDLSTPTKDGSFNIYDDLKKKLMEQGIPEDEIAFIHDADSEAKKKLLFGRVNEGQVRVLIGSTQKMGAGTNVQKKLIALHDLDCPWRPSDLQQRLGRIVRQGNDNEEVEIYRYVTEGTFDAYLYQLVENKQKLIAQIMTSKTPVRVADDVDETALSYSEIKALATGNPLIIEKCNPDMEVAKLNMLKANYLNQRYSLEELVLREYPADIARITERIAGYEKDVALAAAHPKAQEGFCGMMIEGKQYAEKEDAGKAIIDVCSKMTGSDAVLLGEYRGFSMVLAYDGMSNEYRITLKGALSHTVTLGADVFGNITRLDNALENLAGSLQAEKNSLEETKGQLENARAELDTPFAREEELAEKSARLKELNILLKVDEKDKTLIDSVPDEGEEAPQRKAMGLER